LRVGAETLRRWIVGAARTPEEAAGAEVVKAESQQVRQLEKENRDLREANEILKAASIFLRREDSTRLAGEGCSV
jgi:transposase